MSDRYGRTWPEGTEVCPSCGQPDNCGECNHHRLSADQAQELGAIDGIYQFTWSGWDSGEDVEPPEPGKQWHTIYEDGEEYAIIVLRTGHFERQSEINAAEAAREIRAQSIVRALNELVERGDYP